MAKIRKPPKPTIPGGVRGKPVTKSQNMGIRVLKPEHVQSAGPPPKSWGRNQGPTKPLPSGQRKPVKVGITRPKLKPDPRKQKLYPGGTRGPKRQTKR